MTGCSWMVVMPRETKFAMLKESFPGFMLSFKGSGSVADFRCRLLPLWFASWIALDYHCRHSLHQVFLCWGHCSACVCYATPTCTMLFCNHFASWFRRLHLRNQYCSLKLWSKLEHKNHKMVLQTWVPNRSFWPCIAMNPLCSASGWVPF